MRAMDGEDDAFCSVCLRWALVAVCQSVCCIEIRGQIQQPLSCSTLMGLPTNRVTDTETQ